jgi:arsenate reductase
MNTTIYYNPRCSKCRQTLALLREKRIEPRIVSYLESPPSSDKLIEVIRKLGIDPRDIVRFKEPAAKELGLSRKDERSTETWATLLAENPSLLERPIVIHGDKAAIGRPPESVLSIL